MQHPGRTRWLLLAVPLVMIPPIFLSAQDEAIAVLDIDGIGIAENEAAALTNRMRNEIFKIGSQVVER